MNNLEFEKLTKLIRYYILYSTTQAGSGHLTSSLSAVDVMTYLFFSEFRFDFENLDNKLNDHLIFSKGHATPLLYSLYLVCGKLTHDEISKYRTFESDLEGHPTPRFKYTEVATGSLGQGLSVGVGMALATRGMGSKTYVLIGDSELAEGSCWEAIQIASYYKLNNLVAVLDVNRLGQSCETMLGWDVETYKKRFNAFGWNAIVCDGHDFDEIKKAFDDLGENDRPVVVIAKTVKGKGVSFLENVEGWHGKALNKEDFDKAILELGQVDLEYRSKIHNPLEDEKLEIHEEIGDYKIEASYKIGDLVSTRKAYGDALVSLGKADKKIVSLDGETSNSTFSSEFKKIFPERFFEMFIAEQNMVGTAVGLSKTGFVPFVSTFGAFLTRAHDQIRMAAYSRANVKFVGSHSGVAIGADGPSQMGLEDIAMFKTVFGSSVFVPSDAVSCFKLTHIAALNKGIFYIRTQRGDGEVIYDNDETFEIGGSKILKQSSDDKLTIVACGVGVLEALLAYQKLKDQSVSVCVIDSYSVVPIDVKTISEAVSKTNNKVITVEDHFVSGGLGDSVLDIFATSGVSVYKLGVSKMPKSGKSRELLDYESISSDAICKKVLEII